MRYFSKLIFLKFLCVILVNSSTNAKDSRRISLGIGQFNFMEDGTPPHKEQSQMINFEIHSGRKLFSLIKPFAGFLGTNQNAY